MWVTLMAGGTLRGRWRTEHAEHLLLAATDSLSACCLQLLLIDCCCSVVHVCEQVRGRSVLLFLPAACACSKPNTWRPTLHSLIREEHCMEGIGRCILPAVSKRVCCALMHCCSRRLRRVWRAAAALHGSQAVGQWVS